FPHSNSMFDKDELEEERRLAYVAITRAKEKLYLTHAVNRKYFGNLQSNKISRFLENIDPLLITKEGGNIDSHFDSDTSISDSYNFGSNTLNLKIGDKVKHEYFGVGVIKLIDDEII